MKNKMFSIIIPVKEINDYIKDFTPRILKQTYQNFEIIILPNELPKEKFSMKKTRLIASGNVGPAQKRDLGVKLSKGEIIAFIDDDAYPQNDWLEKASKYFEKKEIAGLGGPQLTPKESNYFQNVSGNVLGSWMVSGDQAHRYRKTLAVKECYDLPSCNLFIRKEIFQKVGGFDTSFYPGEDTKLCRDIKNLGKKIIYDPEVIVYHHRRKDLGGYIKQIGGYAKHRGYFMKKYPETSLRPSYFVPALFLLGLIGGAITSFYSQILKIAYLSVLLLYIILLISESIKAGKGKYFVSFIFLAFITHIIYGWGILRGLFKKSLKSKYR